MKVHVFLKPNRIIPVVGILLSIWFNAGATTGTIQADALPAAVSEEAQSDPGSGGIVEVIAGDMVKLDDGRVIRLAGIDAYEPVEFGWVDTINPRRRELADSALTHLSDLALHRKVTLEFPDWQEPSGAPRSAFVFLEDGTFLNEVMLLEGFARILPGSPPKQYSHRLDPAMEKAISEQVRIWNPEYAEIRVDKTGGTGAGGAGTTVPETGADEGVETSGVSILPGIIALTVLVLAGISVFISFKVINATKICPMCRARVRKREPACTNCHYNFKTGFLGDASLQNWMTQNTRIVKRPKAAKTKRSR